MLLTRARHGGLRQFSAHARGDGDLALVAEKAMIEKSGYDCGIYEPMVDIAYVREGDHWHYDSRYVAIAPAGDHKTAAHSPEGRLLTWQAIKDVGNKLENERERLSLIRAWIAVRQIIGDAREEDPALT